MEVCTCQIWRGAPRRALMDQDYWGIDDILAESQKLPCVFTIDVPGLGYLEESGEEDVR